MNTLYQSLTQRPMFEKVELISENEIAITTGLVYDDKTKDSDSRTELTLCLVKTEDTLTLTDKGLTRAYMDEIFELSEPDVIKNILAVTDYYNVSTKIKQLSVEVDETGESICEALLKMVYCIGFLDAMKIFYV